MREKGLFREEKPKVDLIVVLRGGNREDVPDFSKRCTAKGSEAMVTSCKKGNFDWTEGKKNHHERG